MTIPCGGIFRLARTRAQLEAFSFAELGFFALPERDGNI